jgi:hypothetical protein
MIETKNNNINIMEHTKNEASDSKRWPGKRGRCAYALLGVGTGAATSTLRV